MSVNSFTLQHMGALLERHIHTETMRVFYKADTLIGKIFRYIDQPDRRRAALLLKSDIPAL